MNRASVTALLLLSALLCGGCGGARLSAAAFHAKGDRICRQIQRKTESINGPTTRSFNKGLRAVDAGIIRLRKLRPPASDATAYAQFVDRLSRTFARVREDEPRLLALQREFRAALPKRLSIMGVPFGGAAATKHCCDARASSCSRCSSTRERQRGMRGHSA